MTILCIWAMTEGELFGIIGTIFFGTGTLLFLINIVRPNFKFFGNSNSNILSKSEFKEKFESDGIFSFNNKGFEINLKNGQKNILWTEIESMLGYKEDNFTSDTICLDVICKNNKSFKLTEETPGWFNFIKRTKQTFSNIDKNWEIDISTPAFETNLTLIYDKKNRQLNEIMNPKKKINKKGSL
jgi:hypothetical protein